MVGMVKERLKGIEREYAELDTVWYMAGEPVHLCVTSPCVRCDTQGRQASVCACLLLRNIKANVSLQSWAPWGAWRGSARMHSA